MSALGKFKIGIKSKKNFFNFTHDVNTTSDFGFCQPTLIDLVQPGSNVKVNSKQFIRLAPLPTPTFGRVKVHTDIAFVPLKDVYPAFDCFMSKTAIAGRNSYIPQTLDYISRDQFISLLISMSNYYGRLGMFDKCPLRYAYFSRMPLSSDETYLDSINIPYRDILNDSSVVNRNDRVCTAYRFLYEYFADSNSSQFPSSFWAHYSEIMNISGYHDPSTIDPHTGDNRLDGSDRNFPSVLNFLTNVAERNLFTRVGDSGTYPFNYVASFNYINQWQGIKVANNFVNNTVSGRNELNVPVTLDNADYVIYIPQNLISRYALYNQDGTPASEILDPSDAYLCLKLTKFGRRLMRIFTASRQNVFGRYKKNIALSPVLAYYKAWFDFYNPGRLTNWELSNAFYLIHYVYDFGTTSEATINNIASSHDEYRKKFFDFLLDLGKCCYVLPIDNVSVATDTVENNVQSDVNSLKAYFNNNMPSDETATMSVDDDYIYGDYNGDGMNSAGGLGVKMLERVYHWTSENSVVGKKVRDYLKKYNIQLPRTNVLARDSYMCNISDVFSTAETSEGYLGEYAGKGIGSGEVSFGMEDVKEYGYIIQLFSIAPHAGYVQGDFNHPLTRMEFYQPEFDSLGKEPVAMSEISNRLVMVNQPEPDAIFGFRPRYFGLKFRNNIANGYFSERSSRRQYLPYSLDRLFAEKDLEVYNDGKQIRETDEYTPYSGEDIRYVGIDESCGLYDRIFYENDGLVDNFIVNILQDYKVWSPMKPVADSYDTFDIDVHDSTIEVEHS